jgi:hypothetical protein
MLVLDLTSQLVCHQVVQWSRSRRRQDDPFVYSLEGEVSEWFLEQDPNKFSILAKIHKAFNEIWGDQKEDHHLLATLNTSQKKENETIEEFNKKFNDLVKILLMHLF